MTRLHMYLRLAEMTQEQFGDLVGVTGVSVGRYCRDRADPEHRQPRRAVGDRISAQTHGVIHVGNYADEITPSEAAAMMADIAARAAEATA